MIDIHSHILPGVDDGARTLNHSLDLIRESARNGVTDIIATPHYISETIYVSPCAANLRLLSELKKAVKAENIPVNLYLGNEIYIDDNIVAHLKAKEITSLAGSRYLLIELPLNEKFPNYDEYFKDLIDRGVKVILAHPERYLIIQKDYEIARELHRLGVLFQCNMGSLIGSYGKREQKLAQKLAKDKLIFTFASDIHHRRGDEYWQKVYKRMAKFFTPAEIKQLLVTNPGKILEKA
ncbi:hypothetical protein IKZ77_01010 [Candidatus Saccharibacteria bacterium]|nr:hypothetical protein [Candidatus Saccharibacteria bacterium]